MRASRGIMSTNAMARSACWPGSICSPARSTRSSLAGSGDGAQHCAGPSLKGNRLTRGITTLNRRSNWGAKPLTVAERALLAFADVDQ